MAEIGLTETSATSAELVANLVLETLKQNAQLMPTVTDFSRFAVKGAASVDIPRRTQFAAANKSENTDLVAQELTFSKDTISLNLHKAIYAKLEKIADVQASVEVEAEILMEQAKELALQMDKDLLVQLELASAAAPDHRIAYANLSTIQRVDILEARKLLNIQNVPQEDRFLLISPAQEKSMLDIDDFIHVDKYGPSAESALHNGELGRVYGFKVLMSNIVDDLKSVAYHKSAVGFCVQQQPEYKTMDELKSVSKEYLLHWIYGAKVLDTGKRQVLVGTAV